MNKTFFFIELNKDLLGKHISHNDNDNLKQ